MDPDARGVGWPRRDRTCFGSRRAKSGEGWGILSAMGLSANGPIILRFARRSRTSSAPGDPNLPASRRPAPVGDARPSRRVARRARSASGSASGLGTFTYQDEGTPNQSASPSLPPGCAGGDPAPPDGSAGGRPRCDCPWGQKPRFDHAASPWYSWIRPPRRSHRRTSRGLTAIGTSSCAKGVASARERWGRPRL